MHAPVKIELQPLGTAAAVARGTQLQDVLHRFGVEFPCGGRGDCGGCRVRVLAGSLPITEDQRELFSEQELADGWRLACRHAVEDRLVLEVAQWETTVLVDHGELKFAARPGTAIVVDLGTTTIVAQLLDLQTGQVLALESSRNPQAVHGADLMHRIEYGLSKTGRVELVETVRSEVGAQIQRMLASVSNTDLAIERVLLAGNTAMHHFFCDLDLEPLAHAPFESEQAGFQEIDPADLGWALPGDPRVQFLPSLGGFVGSDILAGILATEMHRSEGIIALADLGTNGELAIGNRDRIVCASTAAGPAFEAGQIQMGMQATTGAIAGVEVAAGELRCRVLGGGEPRGICGSGLVDAVACGLETGLIKSNGRLSRGSISLAGRVEITQQDVRQLQLAKGAVAAGIRILLGRLGAEASTVERFYLAGAFGNYVNPTSARRIGLIDFAAERIEPIGNASLLGTKLALFNEALEGDHFEALRNSVEQIPLGVDEDFQAYFIQETSFPNL
ncbi:MAG: hypothetical protein DRH23_05230 [Deltaproteobacteria bacterium]|nr:DUF4445 domain-containing protein [Deltaproteobacteria bacterium]MBW2189594.1 DUF4445 domain-containing protein [Deltaproteobacteria bacterium]MBW2223009.1 DUF4445 domain-containing protein [Deltaproteobacteria bacterium]MBW2403069.1 DUF4445 domain-containing protein [Deltaproteobacteria bacterium]MBW2718265.1 DUF4445 domain-containing protein [Deltaproteobacteria bacterium]